MALAGFLLLAVGVVVIYFRHELQVESDRAARATYQASHDHLTGLLNRAGLIDRIGHARAGSVLHLVDLDGFKGVNDAWGHLMGDRVLRNVGEVLASITSGEAALARVGGDEFALLHGGHIDAGETGRRIIEALRQPFLIDDHIIEIGASVGYAAVARDEDALETVHRADLALYSAKEHGRGQVRAYTADLDTERRGMLDLEEKLRQAIQSDQIAVFFQPLICTRTGSMTGVEALARWTPPTGPISPCVFIPLAERSGLIEPLSKTILERAVSAISALPDIDLSVNISPIQLANPRFAEEITAVLARHAFDPCRLILEVTEGALISQPDRACRSIKALQTIGVRFAMDDFGAGHASIGTLRQFAFDKVKIDRSLIASEDRAVVNATIQLARALGIPVTAEGIETAEQAAFAREAGCELLQGYLLGKPMPFEDLARLGSEGERIAV